MATDTKILEREYIIPLRKEWLKAVGHKRAKKAIRAIREFLSKHMKSEDVRIGKWLNQKIWERGITNPVGKVKVKATKDDKGIVKAELAELPEYAKKIEAKLKEKEEKLKSKKSEEKEKKEEEKKAEEAAKEEVKEEEKEKKEEEKIMHKEMRKEETSHLPKHEHMHEKTKPFRQALKK
jgi:large subunit ribosomal protein L31e